MILLWREDTGGEICKRARRVISSVEVEENFSIRFDIGNQIAPCWVGIILTCGVPKAEEKHPIVLFVDIQSMCTPIKIECDVSFHRKLRFFTGQVWKVCHFRAVIGGENSWDAICFVDVIPGSGGERSALPTQVIPHADAHPIPALDDDHLNAFDLDKTGAFGNIRFEDGEFGLFIPHHHLLPRLRPQRHRSPVVVELTNFGGNPTWELNFVRSIGAELVLTEFEPKEAG